MSHNKFELEIVHQFEAVVDTYNTLTATIRNDEVLPGVQTLIEAIRPKIQLVSGFDCANKSLQIS